MRDLGRQKVKKHESYLRNKDKVLDGNRRRRLMLKQWFAEITREDYCIFCGESCQVCLDYHHRDSNDKSANVSTLLADKRSKERILAELAKCICMCANCHRKHEARMVEIPHDAQSTRRTINREPECERLCGGGA